MMRAMRRRNAIGSPNSGRVRTIGQMPWLKPSFAPAPTSVPIMTAMKARIEIAHDAHEHEGEDALGTMLGDGAGIAHVSRIGQRAVTGVEGS